MKNHLIIDGRNFLDKTAIEKNWFPLRRYRQVLTVLIIFNRN